MTDVFRALAALSLFFSRCVWGSSHFVVVCWMLFFIFLLVVGLKKLGILTFAEDKGARWREHTIFDTLSCVS